MAFWSNLTTIILLVLVPVYCSYRIWKNKYMALLNPSLHLLTWAFVYLTFPVFFMRGYQLDKIFNFSDQIYNETNVLCNWYVFVFLIYYLLSKDKEIEPVEEYRPKPPTYWIAIFFTTLNTIVFVFLLFSYGEKFWSIGDRVKAFKYSGEILGQYKYPVFLNIFIASVAVITWRKRSFYTYLLIPIAISLDLLAKGRVIAWVYLMFAYVNYVAISKKMALTIAVPVALLLVSTVFLRLKTDSHSTNDFLIVITTIFSDSMNNRFVVPICYKDYLGVGNLGEYLLFSLFQFLPNTITLPLFDYSSISQTILSSVVDQSYLHKTGYGLATNIVAESLYYGGIDFAVISPLIIGGVIYGLYVSRVFTTFPGFILFCFIVSGLRGTVRGSFYNSFLPSIGLMYTYLLWLTVLEWGQVALRSKRINN